MPYAFSLDSRLAADTLPVGDLTLSRVLLMNDSRFPWVVLVPRRVGVVELLDLGEADHAALTREIRDVSALLRRLHGPNKLNVAALGNVVAQLHVHVIARFRSDAAWPRPVFSVGEAVPYAPAEADSALAALRSGLGHL
jgi:diadenosine tetraphosphate (Ap4A) HIT family hydrolase